MMNRVRTWLSLRGTSLMRQRRACARLGAAITLISILATPVDRAHAEVTWQVHQLTADALGNTSPHVSGTTYVWRQGTESTGKIMMWSEGDAQPAVISGAAREYLPRISGRRVVWEASVNGDYEIRLWDDGVLTTLTSNSTDDLTPDISGAATVWYAQGSFGLLYDDGNQQHVITAGGFGPDEHPSLEDGLLAWQARMNGSSDSREILLWNGGKMQRLTDNNVPDSNPETDGRTLVWQAENGPLGTSEIWKWTSLDGVQRVTNNTAWDVDPDVSGEAMVFVRVIGGDTEIMLLFDNVEYQITDNDFDDYAPKIDGKRVTWHGAPSGQSQVFYAELGGIDGGGGDDIGACCLGLTCIETTESDCLSQGGSFHGVDASCDVDTCGRRPASTWSTLQHDAQRTGRSNAPVFESPVLMWSLFLGEHEPDYSPVIRPDGSLYVNTNDATAAVGSDGTLRWLSVGNPRAAPAVRRDGDFFVGPQTRILFLSKINGDTGVWDCDTGLEVNSSVAMDSTGSVFIGDSTRLLKIAPDCALSSATNFAANVYGAPAIGQDGAVHVNVGEGFAKVDAETGAIEWIVPVEGAVGAPAVADDGTILRSLPPRTFLATWPDGTNRWTLTLEDAGFIGNLYSPAIAADGTAYFTGRLDSEFPVIIAVAPDGTERWRFIERSGQNELQPIIDGNGLVIFSTFGGDMIALSPLDGTEVWRTNVGGRPVLNRVEKLRDGENQPIDDHLPPVRSRIALDDIGVVRDVNVVVRLDHERIGDLDISLVHDGVTVRLVDQPCGDYSDFDCTHFDDQASSYMSDACQDGFCASYRPASPLRAFNGLGSEGRWELQINDRETGHIGAFRYWTLEVESDSGEPEDFLWAAPIIGDDGVIYARTGLGFLKAFGSPPQCPASDVLSPPYTYRRVATEGTSIDGLIIGKLLSFQLTDDGRVSFLAETSGGSGSRASFVETGDGAFDVVEERGLLDRQRLDGVNLTRRDAAGNTVLPAYILDQGEAVFFNDRLVIQRQGDGTGDAPLKVYGLERFDYADVDHLGDFLVFGRVTQADWPTLLKVDPRTPSITPIIETYDWVEDFRIEKISTTPFGAFGPDGIPVFIASGHSQREGILTPQHVIAEVGDIIDGWTLDDLGPPRRTRSGIVSFIADGSLFVSDVSGSPPVRRRKAGDLVSGLPLAGLTSQMMNNQGDAAYTSLIVGAEEGVFLNDEAVAVSHLSQIDGKDVLYVRRLGAGSADVGVNDAGQVAFIAILADSSISLFVATRKQPHDDNGDCSIDLDDWNRLEACMAGPGAGRAESCAIFDANGDCRVDLVDVQEFMQRFTGKETELPGCR